MSRKLELMSVFLNGYSYQGVTKPIMLPKLTRKLEDYYGAGVNGSASADLGLDDGTLPMEWSLGGFPDSVTWELYAATGVSAVPIRSTGSYQHGDIDETVTVEVVMHGRQKEIDTGEDRQREDVESKISVVCTYFRLTTDGKELTEIDTINMIEKMDGADRLEQHHRNISLWSSPGRPG